VNCSDCHGLEGKEDSCNTDRAWDEKDVCGAALVKVYGLRVVI
jgi:hypothetical protein